MENFTFTPEDNSFIIEADGKKLRISYAEFYGNHEDAMKFCKENGGGDETVENLRFIARYRDAINAKLKELGKDCIEGWYWSNEPSWRYNDGSFVVRTRNGNVISASRSHRHNARAVSAL